MASVVPDIGNSLRTDEICVISTFFFYRITILKSEVKLEF